MNDANYSGCKFSSDILSYMYGELSASTRDVFESHLLECSVCTDEFAEVSAGRYEVYEWKKLAFDPLATPRFEIPSEYEVAAAPSWVDKLRAAFGSSWAAPAFALGGLMIVSIFAASWILSGDNQPYVAANTADGPVVDSPPNVVPSPRVSEPRVETGSTGEIEPQETKPVRILAPRRDAKKIVRSAQPRTIEVRGESARNPRITTPRLNEFADEEDTSLRLAELLDDVETSD